MQFVKGEAAKQLIRRGAMAIAFESFEELYRTPEYVVTLFEARGGLYALTVEYKQSDGIIIFGAREEIELFIKDLLAQFMPDYILLVLEKYQSLIAR